MVKVPKISAAMEKKYMGKSIISLNGKIMGVGSNCLEALKEAQKVMPDIQKQVLLVIDIRPNHIRI